MPAPRAHQGMTGDRARRLAFGTGRIGCAAAVVVCMIARYVRASPWVGPVDFVGYLTIQSNIAYVVVAIAGGVIALRSGLDHPRLDVARVAVLTFVATAGILFALIVQQSGARGIRIDLPWSDIALHFILPVFAAADWLLSPRRHRVSRRILFVIVGYPVVWGVLTMIRGAIVGWYPYYFLDPAQIDSPLEFAGLSLFMLAVFTIVGSLFLAAPSRDGFSAASTTSTVSSTRSIRRRTEPASREPR